jgi:heme exporter protein CcmD
MSGVVQGGWEYVWMAYGLTAAVFVAYGISVAVRYRAELKQSSKRAPQR